MADDHDHDEESEVHLAVTVRPNRASWRTIEEVNVCPLHGNEPTGVEYRAVVFEYDTAEGTVYTLLNETAPVLPPPGSPVWS